MWYCTACKVGGGHRDEGIIQSVDVKDVGMAWRGWIEKTTVKSAGEFADLKLKQIN